MDHGQISAYLTGVDRRKRRRSERVPDPAFDDATKWAVDAGVAVSGGLTTFTAAADGAAARVATALRPVVLAGETYRWTVEVVSVALGGVAFRAFAGGAVGATITTPGVHTGTTVEVNSGAADLGVRAIGSTTAVVTRFSLKKISP